MDAIMHDRTRIEECLREVADEFGGPAKDTILDENFGKHRIELELILKHLTPEGMVLDVGGGLGVNLLCLEKLLGGGKTLALVDKFEEYTQQNRMGPAHRGQQLMRDRGLAVMNQDFWAKPELQFPADTFQVATTFEVIEHLPGHPLAILREMRRVLKPGGVVIVGVPNAVSLVNRWHLLIGKHPYIPFDEWVTDRYFAHYREYTRPECARLLELAGFAGVETLAVPEPYGSRARMYWAQGGGARFTRRALMHYGIHGWARLFANVRPMIYAVGRKA